MRKTATVLLLFALLAGAAGCSGLFDKEYYDSQEYQAQAQTQEDDDEGAIDSISNYTALKRAITRLVSEHVESAQLQFLNYDGTISQDISTACWEVKSSTALGAFAVDYISYDLSRIVSYYQAEIYITYKRSAAQVEALEQTNTVTALAERLDQALRGSETYLVLEISAASVTAETVQAYLQSAYYADPLACPVLPEAEVGLYPESGVSRIVEITLDYGLDSQELAERREALGLAVDVTVAVVTDGDGLLAEEEGQSSGEPEVTAQAQADTLYALCEYMTANCTADEAAGTTAWDALVTGTATSEGMAMAMEAVCQALGIDCQTVAGRLDSETHYWNIVTLDGQSYHVDVSNWDAGAENVFLAGDEQLWGGYWWDTSEYPVCAASYGNFDGQEETGDEADASA